MLSPIGVAVESTDHRVRVVVALAQDLKDHLPFAFYDGALTQRGPLAELKNSNDTPSTLFGMSFPCY